MANPASPYIREVHDADFEKEVIEKSREIPVVVDFWAEWCGPCQLLGPVLEKLAIEGNGRFLLAKLDVDAEPRHAQTFGIRGIPTVIAFRDGAIVSEFSGALPESTVRQFLDKICPSAADELVARAETLREKDSHAAEALLRQALGLDENHAAARVDLAELSLDAGKLEEARELVAPLIPGGELAERIEQVLAGVELGELEPEASESALLDALSKEPDRGDLLLDLGRLRASKGRFPEALDVLLKAAASDRSLAEGDAKELMVRIFHVVGVRSALADEYRAKLARLLY